MSSKLLRCSYFLFAGNTQVEGGWCGSWQGKHTGIGSGQMTSDVGVADRPLSEVGLLVNTGTLHFRGPNSGRFAAYGEAALASRWVIASQRELRSFFLHFS